jgi:hypothetical protein
VVLPIAGAILEAAATQLLAISPCFAPADLGISVLCQGFGTDDRSALAHWIVVLGYYWIA